MRRDHLPETASQTAGPYVHIGLMPSLAGLEGMYGGRDLGSRMVGEAALGERIAIEGRVLDGTGGPLRDAIVEIWQADAAGLHASPAERRGRADPAFTGWGRQPAHPETGVFRFETVKPGRVPWPDGRMQAPHAALWIAARGINLGLLTRVYFADEEAANAEDPVLGRVEPRERAATMIAAREGPGAYRIDIRLQGEGETVFLDV